MLDLKQIIQSINQIAEEKKIPPDKIIEAIETAMAAAYRREYGKKSQIIKAKIDLNTGNVEFQQIKIVVAPEMLKEEKEEKITEDITKETIQSQTQQTKKETEEEIESAKKIKFNPEKHILLEEAQKIKPDAKVNDEIFFPLESKQDFGRIASQTAKQIIIQKIKEIEHETIYNEFKAKEGQIITGIVQRVEKMNVYFDLNKTIGVMQMNERSIADRYWPNQRLKLLVMKTEESPKGPIIFLSRSHPQFLAKLFELEVPEIQNKTVEIKGIAREAGSRSKIAVWTDTPGVDPIGSCVGQRGIRVQMITNELNGEKIDIILWDKDPKKFITNALSPAKPIDVIIDEKNHKATVKISKDAMSLAIGQKGQNVRLAAKLTTWKIDIQTAETGEIAATSDEQPNENLNIEEKESQFQTETQVQKEKK